MRTPTTLAAIAIAASAARAENPKNLLFVGNSFTGSGGGVHLLVQDIATAAGHPTPYVFGRVIGGQTLEWHLATGTYVIDSEIPAGQHWDAVVLQEYSTRPTSHPTDGNVPAFLAAAEGWYQTVLDHSPAAEAVLFETWARAPGNSVYPTYWPGPSFMQSELHDNYNLCRDLLGALGTAEVAPVGDAFELGSFDLSLYGGDLYHASNRGALLMSLVIYGTIYDDTTTSDIDLTDIASGLGLGQTDIDFATDLADRILVPSPAGASLFLALGLVAPRRRRQQWRGFPETRSRGHRPAESRRGSRLSTPPA